MQNQLHQNYHSAGSTKQDNRQEVEQQLKLKSDNKSIGLNQQQEKQA